MIAKIGRSSNLFGALSYNNIKVQQEKGKILFTHKIVETSCGEFTIPELMRSFEPYLLSNRKTEKHTLHISINPDPKDKVSNEQFITHVMFDCPTYRYFLQTVPDRRV